MAERLSVVGLGKLGMCLAACLAERGFDTIGVDVEELVVDAVNHGRSPIVEPRLDELVARHGGSRLRATHSHAEAIAASDVTFVLVATPSNPDGSFSNRYVESALHSLALALRDSPKPYHLFVISSTVVPGSTEHQFVPLLEQHSGRRLNEGFGVCYDPDFVALGNVVQGFLRPDLVIVGESDPAAGARVQAIHEQMCENAPAISRMSITSAEIAKVCLNAYITVKISFANSVANLCESIPGADVDAITRAIGADRRISPYYFSGGLSFGGTCFPRDTRAYMTIAAQHGVQADLVRATDEVNRYQDLHLTEVVLRELDRMEDRTVGVLGLSFVPNTPVITESPGIKLVQELLRHDLRIVAYDRLAVDAAKALFGETIEYVSSPHECLAQSSVAVLTYRAPEFREAVTAFQPTRPLTVVDGWRIVAPGSEPCGVRLVGLGRWSPAA